MKQLVASLLFCWAVPAAVQAQTAPALKSGEQVYCETCIACHGPGANSGLANVPRVGDRQAWGKLIAEGQHVPTAHAVAWMARASGGNWKDRMPACSNASAARKPSASSS